MRFCTVILIPILFASLQAQPSTLQLPVPKSYTILKTTNTFTIDGKPLEPSWDEAPWTDYFLDIEGDKNPKPYYDTRVKMLWDDEYLYFYAEMEEEHVWGNITERDAVIFHNNDFEVFVKPNDLQPYYGEFEVNVLGTLWELFLARPYRRNGPVLNHWDVNDTQIGIDVKGTVNDPTDTDTSWSVELAIPIQALKDIDRGSQVQEGTVWRINFSRVQWQHQINDGVYSRKKDEEGNRLHENNWVWTEQSAIAMHRPEHWGYVFFTEATSNPTPYTPPLADEYQLLFHLYRIQMEWWGQNKSYTSDISKLGGSDFLVNGTRASAEVSLTRLGFEITVSNSEGQTLTVNQDGYVLIE